MPSTFLGLVLGWVCYRTGSVLPGMLLHASHNGLLLLMVQNTDYLKSHGWGLQESAHSLGLAGVGRCGYLRRSTAYLRRHPPATQHGW